jgi:hypothetical protein
LLASSIPFGWGRLSVPLALLLCGLALHQNINLLYELFLLIFEFKEQLFSLLQFGSEAFYLFHHLLIVLRQLRLSFGNRSKLLVLALLGLELPLEFIML